MMDWIEEKLGDGGANNASHNDYENFMGINGLMTLIMFIQTMVANVSAMLVREGRIRITLRGAIASEVVDSRYFPIGLQGSYFGCLIRSTLNTQKAGHPCSFAAILLR